MTRTEWITDIALLLVVFRQLREGRLEVRTFLIPLAIISYVVHSYLTAIPTDGNDLELVATLVATGATLGIVGGLYTRIRIVGGQVMIKAGAVAAALWVLGMGARMTFQLWSEHGGAARIAHFSLAHDITSNQAWVAAFVLMALTEVVTRLATIGLRAEAARRPAPVATPIRVQAPEYSA